MQSSILQRQGLRQDLLASTRLPRNVLQCSALTQGSSSAPKMKSQPVWTGDTLVSNLVNAMINTPAIYKVMTFMARRVMTSTAEKRGIMWTQTVRDLSSSEDLLKIKDSIENKRIQYPDYYLQPFHAYADGNLNWAAAYEAEPASYVTAARTFPKVVCTPEEANAMLRQPITDAINNYIDIHNLVKPEKILDAGCSVGVSSRWLAYVYPEADIVGLDASSYFIAVAELQERRRSAGRKKIQYVHRLVEQSGFPDNSFDLITFQFVAHECPPEAIQAFFKESKRLVRSGGVVAFVDLDPRSETIQNLPPALFTLMKSTEPWSDVFYSYDMEQGMREEGLTNVVTVETDHRHRAILGTVP